MRHRATQLILPFEPALPGRQLILAPRLWPTMTPTTQQQLAKRVGTAAPVNAGRSRRRRFDRGASR
jgi:hypothetical protein